MMGVGLACARPDRRVLVLTGDGEMLMGLGSLATAGVQKPANLSVVVLDNERYGETGMQPTHTAHGVDLAVVAAACGFGGASAVTGPAEVASLRAAIHRGAGPGLRGGEGDGGVSAPGAAAPGRGAAQAACSGPRFTGRRSPLGPCSGFPQSPIAVSPVSPVSPVSR